VKIPDGFKVRFSRNSKVMPNVARCLRPGPHLSALLAAILLATACGGAGGGVPAPPPKVEGLSPASYVTVETGTLPVVLSAPHGGTTPLPGVAERVAPDATTVLDTATLELATAVQGQLFALTGRKAHLVAALASRKYVDFNRSAAEAYEDAKVAPVYGYYHAALQAAVTAARAQSPAGAILLDLHGQGSADGLIFRGTQFGNTADLPTLYRKAPNGLITEMLARGLAVSPGSLAPGEQAGYTGGYIVETYGFPGGAGNRVNAVQLEFGFSFRSPGAAQTATATALAAAIKAHLLAAGALP
jgi:N-formylglutamate amidohydrolase